MNIKKIKLSTKDKSEIKKIFKLIGIIGFAAIIIVGYIVISRWVLYFENKDKILGQYKSLVNINEEYKSVSGQNRKNVEEFDIEKYGLPFKNFSSILSPGGNCEGMTYYVLKNFLSERKEIGNLSISDSDSKVLFEDGNIKADLSKVSGDIDYESVLKESFLLKRDKDKEDGNYSSDTKFESKELGELLSYISNLHSNKDDLNYSVYESIPYYSSNIYAITNDIDKYRRSVNPQIITDLIDDNKPVMIGLRADYVGGHALLAYGYEKIDKNNVKVYVYDTNLPFKKEYYNDYNNIYMLFTKELDSKNWSYIYRPTIEGKTIYSSYNSIIPGSTLSVYYNYEE